MSWKKEKPKEFLVFEPEDWTVQEWKTICKIFVGEENTKQCEVIKVSNYTLESFITKK